MVEAGAYQLLFEVDARTDNSLPVIESLPVALTVTAPASPTFSTVHLDSSPVIGTTWTGITIAPRDSDDLAIYSGGDAFEISFTKQRDASGLAEQLDAACRTEWVGSRNGYEGVCIVPNDQGTAGDWQLEATLDGEPFFSTVVEAQCDDGHYQDGGVCHVCPKGAVCDLTGLKLSTLMPKNGYWRVNTESAVLYACPLAAGCTDRPQDEPCAKGHLGVKCALCENDYYFSEFNGGGCKPCEGSRRLLVHALLIAGAAVVAVLIGYVILRRLLRRYPSCLPAGLRIFDIAKFKVRTHHPPTAPLC